MKVFLTIITCILFQTTFAQFGIIADKDGFVNIRNSPKNTNNIIGQLNNGQIVFCLEEEGNWRPIDYDLSRNNKSGYIHKSKIKLIKSFEKLPYNNLTDYVIKFKKDSITLIITKTTFNSKTNKLQYHKRDASKNEIAWLEKINGKEIWGTDGNVPKNQYGQMTLTIGKNKINLPFDNLYEPNLDNTTVNLDKKNNTIFISSLNGDGAGGYAVLWIIENGKFKQKITTIPF